VQGTLLQRFAAWLLRAGIRLAPGDMRQWGEAMLSELHHIEGNWAAVGWALGGAGVLAKQSLIALLLPTRSRDATPVGNPLAREGKMHKASLITGGACLAAVLLFFLAPVFRQGFRVSLAQWRSVIHVDQSQWYRQPELESFARRMEKNQDAEGMAFVAARLNNSEESVRLADEAVRLDPKLIWIFGVVGARHANAPAVSDWVQKLKKWDPGNALPYLILAQRADMERMASASGGSTLHPRQSGAAWMDAMEGAFSSNRIDDYTDRLRALDRTVARRYGLNDPYFVVGMWNGFYLPGRLGFDSTRYAKLTIASGDALEARGDLNGATEKYLQVANFLHLYDPYATLPFFVDSQEFDVYTRLARVYKRMGKVPQSAYFGGLAATTKYRLEQDQLHFRNFTEKESGLFGVTPWSALTVELSDAGMLVSFCLVLIAFLVVLAKSRSLKPSKLQIGPVPTALGFLGSVGLLVSSVALYIAYRPYAAIYTRFLQTGDTSQLKILSDFLDFTRTPIGTQAYRSAPLIDGHTMLVPYISTHTFTFYFWLAVSVVGVAALAAIGGWHLLKWAHPRSGAAA
jgi:hypothetical protein